MSLYVIWSLVYMIFYTILFRLTAAPQQIIRFAILSFKLVPVQKNLKMKRRPNKIVILPTLYFVDPESAYIVK